MLPKTNERVRRNTRPSINRAIDRQTETRIRRAAEESSTAVDKRLIQLEHEWDMERTLEANAAAVSLLGIALGARNKRFLALPAAVAGFLLQHALQGWCPPVPLFRRLGVRTAGEIAKEKFALKAMRGDFDELPAEGKSEARVKKIMQAVETKC